jgi:hypothetical protein
MHRLLFSAAVIVGVIWGYALCLLHYPRVWLLCTSVRVRLLSARISSCSA